MQQSQDLPDEVPVADAIEQQREFSEPPVDEEDSAEYGDTPPLEASPADWQDQLEAVEIEPDDDTVAE